MRANGERGTLAAEPVRGTLAYLAQPGLIGVPGLEQIQRMVKREVPPPPLWYVSGLDVVEADLGAATYRLPATAWLRSPAGFPTPGVWRSRPTRRWAGRCTRRLPANAFVLTANLTLDMVGVPQPERGAFLAAGRLIRGTRDQGLTWYSCTSGGPVSVPCPWMPWQVTPLASNSCRPRVASPGIGWPSPSLVPQAVSATTALPSRNARDSIRTAGGAP